MTAPGNELAVIYVTRREKLALERALLAAAPPPQASQIIDGADVTMPIQRIAAPQAPAASVPHVLPAPVAPPEYLAPPVAAPVAAPEYLAHPAPPVLPPPVVAPEYVAPPAAAPEYLAPPAPSVMSASVAAPQYSAPTVAAPEYLAPPVSRPSPALSYPAAEPAPYPAAEPASQHADEPVAAPRPTAPTFDFATMTMIEPEAPVAASVSQDGTLSRRAQRKAARAEAEPEPQGRRARRTAAEGEPAAPRRARRDAEVELDGEPQARPSMFARRRASAELGSRAVAFIAILGVGGLLVSTSIPANTFYQPQVAQAAAEPAPITEPGGQTFAAPTDFAAGDVARDSFTVTSYAQQLKQRYGNSTWGYPATAGPIRWPFPYEVPISDGYGLREPPCDECSEFHEGTDFVPGAGAPTYVIAAGTVVWSADSDTGLGTQVRIEHSINGQTITSIYGHMATDSSPLRPGMRVEPGDFVGLVGETGQAFGAHLHFGLLVNGDAVDPEVWLTENVSR